MRASSSLPWLSAYRSCHTEASIAGNDSAFDLRVVDEPVHPADQRLKRGVFDAQCWHGVDQLPQLLPVHLGQQVLTGREVPVERALPDSLSFPTEPPASLSAARAAVTMRPRLMAASERSARVGTHPPLGSVDTSGQLSANLRVVTGQLSD